MEIHLLYTRQRDNYLIAFTLQHKSLINNQEPSQWPVKTVVSYYHQIEQPKTIATIIIYCQSTTSNVCCVLISQPSLYFFIIVVVVAVVVIAGESAAVTPQSLKLYRAQLVATVNLPFISQVSRAGA